MNKRIVVYYYILIAGCAAFFFISFIGRVHLFDWDEINFAESAREMILTKNYLSVQISFMPFWEKPPLFIWLQVLSMKVFGINEFAARFPNAMCGIFTLLILFEIGRKLYNIRFGLIWVMTYACSLLPFFYFKSGIIDPWFNLFILLSIYFWLKAFDSKIYLRELYFMVTSASMLGLAILTKGPAALIIFGLVVLIIFLLNGFKVGLNWKNIAAFILVLTLIGGFWFILQILTGNYNMVEEFVLYQIRLFKTEDAGHGGFPFYHFVVLLIGVFPASIFAIQGHRYKGQRDFGKIFHTSMVVLLWVVLLLFSVVKTKIVHYSSLCYFPITYLGAYSVSKILDGSYKFRIWQRISLALIAFILLIIVMILPLFNLFKELIIKKIKINDAFTLANLQADPGWTYFHSSISVLLLLAIIISILFIKKNKILQMGIIFSASLLFIYSGILFITPGAEKISQYAAIEFLIDAGKKDAYVYSFHKSYAPLFYSRLPVPVHNRVFEQQWLTTGTIDKDVYFLARNRQKEEILKSYPEIELLGEKNGYVFLIRHAKDKNNIE